MKLTIIGQEPAVEMSVLANKKMDLLVEMCNTEVGWLGLVNRRSSFDFFVEDIFIVEQQVHSATTEIMPSGHSTLWEEMMANGAITVEEQDTRGLYLWGHSHHNMGVSPSTQDNTQFEKFFKGGGSPPPYFVRMIVNKRQEYKVDIWLHDDHLKVEDATLMIETEGDAVLEAFLKAEVEAKVSQISSTYKKKTTGGAGDAKFPSTPGELLPQDAEFFRSQGYFPFANHLDRAEHLDGRYHSGDDCRSAMEGAWLDTLDAQFERDVVNATSSSDEGLGVVTRQIPTTKIPPKK